MAGTLAQCRLKKPSPRQFKIGMPTHQFLIASYYKDFPWLRNCLRSIKKFVHDPSILRPVICVDASDWPGARHICAEVGINAEVKIKDGRPGFGNIRAQIAMMSGDKLCPDADFTWLLGSDSIVTREFSPDEFFVEGKPRMFITSYDLLIRESHPAKGWRAGTEAIVGFRPEHEFMRMSPRIYPRQLFPHARDYISEKFSGSFEDVCHNLAKPSEKCDYGFSESNIMGAFAYRFRPDLYHWALTDPSTEVNFNRPFATFWSHGGFDRPTDVGKVQGSENPTGRTPREIITEVLGSC